MSFWFMMLKDMCAVSHWGTLRQVMEFWICCYRDSVPRRVSLTRQQVTSLKIRENRIWTYHQHAFWVCPAIPFRVFVSTQILHLSTHTERGLFLPRHSQILLFFSCKTCASHRPSSQSCVRLEHGWVMCKHWSMVRKVDEPWTKCRNSTDLDWTRAFAHDGRDPRSWPQTRPCRGQHVVEQSNTANEHGAWNSCARCALRLHYPRNTTRMTSVSTPSPASTAKAVRDMIAEVEGRKPRKKKAPPQPTIVFNTVYTSGSASSATTSSSTPVHTEISTPPSPRVSPITRRWRLFVVSILQTERIRVRRRNALMMEEDLWRICRDVWHGNFSEVHRWSMRVLSKQIQMVLDAGTDDRCAFVEICDSDFPCLTEAMQQRGISSSSLLRSDGVGNHDAQTREKLLGWFSEQRLQKSLSDRFFDSFLSMPQQSCNLVVTFIGNGLQSVTTGRLSSCVILKLSRKVVLENCLWQRLILASSRKQTTICWNIIVGNSSHSILVSKSTWVSTVKEITNMCGNEHMKARECIGLQWFEGWVNGFVHDLRPPQLHIFLSEADRLSSASPAVFVASPAQRKRRSCFASHVAGGHVSKMSLWLLLQRRGCPVWMQHTGDQLQCDSCLESSDTQNAQRVSLATPPKLWQALKVDIFELEDSHRKGFFALYMDAAAKLSSCSCILEGNARQRFEPNGATLISHLANDWMQRYPQFQFLISDPGGCFVTNELREWAGVRGIGLLAAPGEIHAVTADLENLIRVIKRLARKLADDHLELTLSSCVSLACSSHNNGFKTGGYSAVQWAFEADNEGHGVTTTMPSEIETFWISAMNRYLQEQARDAISRAQHTTRTENFRSGTWNLGDVFSSWQSDSRTNWRSIQVRSLAGTRSCHHDRGSQTMEWIGAFHGRTNWCRLGASWKQIDQMSSHSAPSMQWKRGIDCFSERSCAYLNADERDRTDECFVSWTIRRPVDKFANSRWLAFWLESGKTSESEFAGIRVPGTTAWFFDNKKKNRISNLNACSACAGSSPGNTPKVRTTPTNSSLKLPSHVNDLFSARQRQESLTAQELSMLRGVLGAASCIGSANVSMVIWVRNGCLR